MPNLNRYTPALRLFASAFAFWVIHIALRIFLIFRPNAYGVPYVNKPDWFIFHAATTDFVWIFAIALPFSLLALWKPKRALFYIYFVLQSVLLCFSYFDHEVQRFLGSHLTLSLMDGYKDTSSLVMLVDYVAEDLCIPWIQFIIMPLLVPVAVLAYRGFRRMFAVQNEVKLFKILLISILAFGGASELFLHVIWPGGNRAKKIAPVIKIWAIELATPNYETLEDSSKYEPYVSASRNFWAKIEGESASDWEYPDLNCPLCRVYVGAADSLMLARRAAKPNFIVVFLESGRGLDVGYLNPEDPRGSVTPTIDSLARVGQAFTRFYSAGVPTVAGVLSSHLGTPCHRTRAIATEFTTLETTSFASALRDSGYVAHFFAAADPGWDNLSVWFQKWYDRTHYSRDLEDDSTFFDATAAFIRDTLSKTDKPFLAAMITRSNHYPFNLVPGIPDSVRALPQAERMRYTMHWMDAQLGRFVETLKHEPWMKNTYLIVLADHGFPQGENGITAIDAAGGSTNATWIPFVVNGPGLENGGTRSPSLGVPAGQHDLAPTILALAGLRSPNAFLGHDLFRDFGDSVVTREGFAVGAYNRAMSVTYKGARLLTGSIDEPREFGEKLYEANDPHETRELQNERSVTVDSLRALVDTLLSVNDFAIAKNRMKLK